MASEYQLTWEQIAERIEETDVEAFAWLLGLEFSHDDEPQECKAMIVQALRFAALVGFEPERWTQKDLDEARAKAKEMAAWFEQHAE